MADRETTEIAPTPLDGAGLAVQMCAQEYDLDTYGMDLHATDIARAAVVAYLNLTGRDAEAEALAHAR